MYKRLLLSNLFSHSEIFSYYLLRRDRDGRFTYKSITDIGEYLNISRRHIYNLINRFEKNGILEKKGNSAFLIRNEHFLIKNSEGIIKFFENKY